MAKQFYLAKVWYQTTRGVVHQITVDYASGAVVAKKRLVRKNVLKPQKLLFSIQLSFFF